MPRARTQRGHRLRQKWYIERIEHLLTSVDMVVKVEHTEVWEGHSAG
jgi:hypothetical protein